MLFYQLDRIDLVGGFKCCGGLDFSRILKGLEWRLVCQAQLYPVPLDLLLVRNHGFCHFTVAPACFLHS